MIEMLLNNRYRAVQTLGSGGFGETFLAEDTQMPSLRRCVIKQLKPIHHNPQIYQLVQERFQREAAILEELGGDSNQIPSLYAYFQFDGQFYLVQEWIEGETLTAKMQQQGLLGESVVQKILIDLLSVLEYIHGQGIVHRDIKPDNIIMRYKDGKPVLIDFGAVRETMGTEVNSQGNPSSSIVIGTPGYMPSEQAMGKPVYASDLYSLGLTAIYLLTGKSPQTLETDSQTGEINWERNTVSPSFAALLDKAIAYHPRDRTRSTKEMLEALQSLATPTIHIINSLPSPITVQQKTAVTLLPSHQSLVKKGILFSALIAGALTSVFLLTQILVTKHSQVITPTKVLQSVQLPITTTGDDYSWLAKRAVTASDLEDKDSLQLDIMRNSIFARHGRRFNTVDLQKYFDSKVWYHPSQYSPSEFDQLNLLSKLEQQNAAYIDAYQDQHNKRYFSK
ncbi:MAG: YARHG domain-containing protein [Rhizonema sp. NSF051]|nr:YARHG domain-containing protein [Rhizonema sp. NSF051]